MTKQDMKRRFTSYEGFLFTLIFTLIFIITNLIMIDFRSIQNTVTGQTPFYILIILAILAYLYKNSAVEMTKPRVIFLGFWILYVLSMFISML
ncbi:MAG TPA: O-antigen ligase domain-containing protein, partial [Candidatus Dormibacteraeota bacterium]|nr:O-antigen ligase domain-containing protein [Candidatus Dormibacteraeota bacterium]